jgi:hypothetical protein
VSLQYYINKLNIHVVIHFKWPIKYIKMYIFKRVLLSIVLKKLCHGRSSIFIKNIPFCQQSEVKTPLFKSMVLKVPHTIDSKCLLWFSYFNPNDVTNYFDIFSPMFWLIRKLPKGAVILKEVVNTPYFKRSK